MKLNITFFALSLLFSIPSFVYAEAHTLKSEILKSVDGLIVDGPTIAMIKKYQIESISILLGKRQPNGRRVGLYTHDSKYYSATQLCELESNGKLNEKSVTSLLNQMRKDFERISAPFQQTVRSVKPMIAELILQSNHLRGRHSSLLNKWAHPSIVDDQALFDKHVHTIKEFETFLIDLHNFLNDLVESCPKGQKLYLQWKNELLKKQANS